MLPSERCPILKDPLIQNTRYVARTHRMWKDSPLSLSLSLSLSNHQNRDKSRVVIYRCPSNSAVQVYNYQHKTARVVFGPNLVILEPHETFNVLFLSGKHTSL